MRTYRTGNFIDSMLIIDFYFLNSYIILICLHNHFMKVFNFLIYFSKLFIVYPTILTHKLFVILLNGLIFFMKIRNFFQDVLKLVNILIVNCTIVDDYFM